jgi:hypothetical protein
MVFGDSHVRCYLDHDHLDGFYGRNDQFHDFSFGGYDFKVMKLGQTGATVYGLLNDDSETQAGQNVRKYAEGAQHVVIVLGEVDVRNFLSRDEDPWTATMDVMDRYKRFLQEAVIPQISGRLVLANSLGHSLESLRVHGRAALAVLVFNDALRTLARNLGVGYLNLYGLSVDDLGTVPISDVETDGLLCHVVPDKIRDRLRRETVKVIRGG